MKEAKAMNSLMQSPHNRFVNPLIINRFNELIIEGECQWEQFQGTKSEIRDPVRYTRWTTSCLNLLDKLSASTNRFVKEFEEWANRGAGRTINVGAALGVLKSAKDEYELGLAIEYHLSVTSAVFGGLIEQAEYLCNKGFLQASAVLAGAALEEALKAKAKTIPVELPNKATLIPILHRLKSIELGIISEFDASKLEIVAKIRNSAAHSDGFNYTKDDVVRAIEDVRLTLQRIFGER